MRNLASLLILTLFNSLTFLSSTLADFNEKCKEIKAKSAIVRLNSYIKCDLYKRSGTIRDSKSKTDIYIMMRAELLNFDESSNNLEIEGFLFAGWTDENIQWNYTSYDNIKSMPIYSIRDIWTPDITVLSAGNDKTDVYRPNDISCKLHHNGKVVCINILRCKVRCQTDFKLWPYDRQYCTLVITSWAYSSEQLSLTFQENTVFMSMFRSNGEWNYSVSGISYEQRESNHFVNVSSPQISVYFVLDRLHTHLRGRYIAPGIIMMVLTLTTLWLDPKSIERLAIASLNIIIHMMCIQDLHWTLPHNGTTIPNILIFYVNSFVLATVALLLTFFLRKIKETKVSTPKWISSSIALILRSKVGQFLLLGMLDPKVTAGIEVNNDDSSDLMNSEPKDKTWTYVVILFGWISVLSFFFIYIIMYIILIPSSAAKTPIEPLTNYDRVDDQFGVIGD